MHLWSTKQRIKEARIYNGHIQTEVKDWKKIFHANGDQKKAGVATLLSDKIDFEIKTMIRNK